MAVELNIATAFGAVAARYPQRAAIIQGEQSVSFGELSNRANALARVLAERGIGCHTERDRLAGHRTGQDLVGQLLHNGVAYLEGMFGTFRARAVPFNINYRYTADELRGVLTDASPRALQFHATFAPLVAEVVTDLAPDTLLLQVADTSGNALIPGALDFDEIVAATPADPPAITVSPDDLYLIYTGGTTGSPKGVLWRQSDAAVSLLRLVDRRTGQEWSSLDAMVDGLRTEPVRILPSAPFMHGGGQWAALQALCEGNTVSLQSDCAHFDPADIWDTAEAHRVHAMLIIGDAFARPLVAELERRKRDLSTLRLLVSGGAATQTSYKERIHAAIPGVAVLDRNGASESGTFGHRRSADASGLDDDVVFDIDDGTVVVDEERTKFLGPGHDGTGWLGKSGRIPLGYLNDGVKTEATFPVVAGRRIALPGDRAQLLADGRVRFLGRDSTVINSGGEKVFAEEVEAAVRSCPGVADAVVCGRPSGTWGSEVVALVAATETAAVTLDVVRAHCAKTLAGYKLPKAVMLVDSIRRTAAGKADYRWARELVALD